MNTTEALAPPRRPKPLPATAAPPPYTPLVAHLLPSSQPSDAQVGLGVDDGYLQSAAEPSCTHARIEALEERALRAERALASLADAFEAFAAQAREHNTELMRQLEAALDARGL